MKNKRNPIPPPYRGPLIITVYRDTKKRRYYVLNDKSFRGQERIDLPGLKVIRIFHWVSTRFFFKAIMFINDV